MQLAADLKPSLEPVCCGSLVFLESVHLFLFVVARLCLLDAPPVRLIASRS